MYTLTFPQLHANVLPSPAQLTLASPTTSNTPPPSQVLPSITMGATLHPCHTSVSAKITKCPIKLSPDHRQPWTTEGPSNNCLSTPASVLRQWYNQFWYPHFTTLLLIGIQSITASNFTAQCHQPQHTGQQSNSHLGTPARVLTLWHWC